ncbi:MAG: hypothetical protein KHZ10_06895 [Clostridium sp.]|nr:hypothetical protein [Clostridium sp.]
MKWMKRGIAVLLAAAVMVPELPVSAAFGVEQKSESQEAEKPVRIRLNTPATSSNAPEKKKEDGVVFNTGNMPVHVTEEEAFEEGLGDVCFEEDGSYTIEIPESDPFFPYEVQFTWDGKTDEKWFMTPEDSVTVDGHTFYVNGNFDGSAVTRFNLEVAGTTVPVYPERKEFTDDGGIMPLSLLPLEEKYLTVDLTGFTPVELTQVAMKDVFAGERELTETDRIMWTWRGKDDYEISLPGDKIDLSYYTVYGEEQGWEMIVGNDDQLAASNIRYQVEVKITESKQWLIPSVYEQTEDGTRKKLTVAESFHYDDYNLKDDNRELWLDVDWDGVTDSSRVFLGLEVDRSLFGSISYDQIKAYSGKYVDAQEAVSQETDITDKLLSEDMTKTDAGWSYPEIYQAGRWVTFVAYDAAGNVCGCLPFKIRLYYSSLSYVDVDGLYEGTGEDRGVEFYPDEEDIDETGRITFTLDYGMDTAVPYYLVLNYERNGMERPEAVTAAFAGRYNSIKEAKDAGAENIAAALFDESETGGYPADYSKGVELTIFVGEDGAEGQEIYQYLVQTKEGKPTLNSNTAVIFTGLWGERLPLHDQRIPQGEDDYAERTYITYFVEPDTDLTKIAPEFELGEGVRLYAEGSSTPEVSGESFHDFSSGPIQYTASSENGSVSRNYWLQVVKEEEGAGKLYINSLADKDAETKEEDGVIYSTREMFLDGRYDYKHDIVVANVGTEPIENLTAEVVSDEVELDSYWTLKGESALGGMDIPLAYYQGQFSNLAKLRLVLKDGVDDGREINGTLTLRSGDEVLMVLTLTGIAGDPGILTKEIPDAVKYVPYGTMIQNSNKYEWNKVSYEIDGDLPAGMTLKPNGEIYGVPTETGEFTFTVTMDNSFNRFSDSKRTFTMTVLENTDANVDAATDEGYYLKEKVQNVSLASSADQTLVSNGEYGEFTDIFLDGVKLVSGVDYTSESGSTRITIRSQTLKASNQPGTHTLGVEFRTKDTSTLKRAAQNYQVTEKNNGGNGGNSDGGSSGGNSGSSGSGGGNGSNGGSGNRAEEPSPITWTSGRGYVHNTRGVITGEGAGYAHWVQDDRGWKLVYPNGSFVTGAMMVQEDQSTVEQVAWELVNGSWYAFGADGYIKSGWVFDYQLGRWYNMSIDRGMQTGWYTDPQDQYTYYMEPGGQLATGWKQIESNWYYFNAVIAPRTWEIDPVSGNWYYNVQSKSQPFGSLYRGKTTPDGYFVDENGVWNGNRIQ